MNRGIFSVGLAAFCVWASPVHAGKCPPDSVKVGNVCIDTYEASVWQIAPSNTKLVRKVEAGKATLADLTGGGATEVSPDSQHGEPAVPVRRVRMRGDLVDEPPLELRPGQSPGERVERQAGAEREPRGEHRAACQHVMWRPPAAARLRHRPIERQTSLTAAKLCA